MLVDVENEQVTSIKGDPENPDSHGFLCIRGQATHEIPLNPLRLNTPLRRVGERGEDRWEPITWEDAYTILIEHIQQTRRDRVGIWSGHGALATASIRPLIMRFGYMGGFQVWNPAMICWALGAYGLALTGVLEANTKEDMGTHSRTILLWGANLTSQPTTAPYLKQARKKGATIIHIDCRANEASHISDEVYLIQPGSDAALALALAHVIIQEGLTDQSFLHANTVGYEAFANHLTSCTPEWAEPITGISAERIRSLAHRYATQKPSIIVLGGSSMFKHAHGWEAGRAIACLPALIGQLGQAGGGFGPRHRAFVHADGQADVQAIAQRPPGTYIPNHMASIANAMATGKIDMLFLFGSNILSSFSSAASLEKSLQQVKLVVAFDIFMNETIRRVADLILPGTIWLEELGLKETASHIYLMERALQPVTEVRPLMRILRDLAGRLNINGYFPWQDEEEYLNTLLAPQHTDNGESLTIELLRQKGGIWQKSSLSHIAYPDLKFHTPSGKIEFWSERAQKVGLSPLPTFTPLQNNTGTRYPLQFRQGRTITAFHAFYDEGSALPSLARASSEPELWIHPSDAHQRGIETGSPIQIFNQRGQFQAKAYVTAKVLQGVIWMRDGWVGVNDLTNAAPVLSPLASDLIDPYMLPGGQAAFDAFVEVQKV
jgi:anaerobic selenocysteine-containing dehydrogenase